MSKAIKGLVGLITSVVVLVGIAAAGPFSWAGVYQPKAPKKS